MRKRYFKNLMFMLYAPGLILGICLGIVAAVVCPVIIKEEKAFYLVLFILITIAFIVRGISFFYGKQARELFNKME